MDCFETIKRSGSLVLLFGGVILLNFKTPSGSLLSADFLLELTIVFAFFSLWYFGALIVLSERLVFKLAAAIASIGCLLGSAGLYILMKGAIPLNPIFPAVLLSWALIPIEEVRVLLAANKTVSELQGAYFCRLRHDKLGPSLRLGAYHTVNCSLVYVCLMLYQKEKLGFAFESALLFIIFWSIRERVRIRA